LAALVQDGMDACWRRKVNADEAINESVDGWIHQELSGWEGF
jgi:hypothetical protein